MRRRVHTHYVPEPVGEHPDLDLFEGVIQKLWFASGYSDPQPPAQPVDTSLEAAARIQGHTARLREAVFQFIRVTGGATAGEIATGCGLNPSTVRPRLRELQGDAPWCGGKLPARIERTPERRAGMRVYKTL